MSRRNGPGLVPPRLGPFLTGPTCQMRLSRVSWNEVRACELLSRVNAQRHSPKLAPALPPRWGFLEWLEARSARSDLNCQTPKEAVAAASAPRHYAPRVERSSASPANSLIHIAAAQVSRMIAQTPNVARPKDALGVKPIPRKLPLNFRSPGMKATQSKITGGALRDRGNGPSFEQRCF